MSVTVIGRTITDWKEEGTASVHLTLEDSSKTEVCNTVTIELDGGLDIEITTEMDICGDVYIVVKELA